MRHRHCQVPAPPRPGASTLPPAYHTFADSRTPPSSVPSPPTRGDVEWLFARLFGHYGPRNWWPTVHGGDYELVVGAILVQNVSWRSTRTALQNLLDADIWSFDSIRDADDELLHDLVRPAVYWRMKTRKLKEFANFILDRHDGDLKRLFELPLADMREQLLGVWGIGPETADDIVLYGANKPSFVIDAYTKRLLTRLGFEVSPQTYDAYQQLFHESLPHDAELFNEYHALIDYHCARVCRARPSCGDCALAESCPVGLGLTTL